MDIRFQHLFLIVRAVLLSFVAFSVSVKAEDSKGLNINNEIFELGAFVGIVNIEDFTSEIVPGISLTFRASEDFFIQYNYVQISKVDLPLYELQEGTPTYFTGKGRKFRHYDLLVGYNIFQGEFFRSQTKTSLSNLYFVAGAGETSFGEEARFSYTIGLGYQVALTKRVNVNIDYKNYIYDSSVIMDQDKTVNTTQISAGVNYIF